MSENLTNELPPNAVHQILTTLSAIDLRLTRLEERDEKRAYDTKPIWEQVLTQLGELRSEFNAKLEELRSEFNTKLEELRSEFNTKLEDVRLDMRAGFRRLERQMERITFDVYAVRTDQGDLERRMDRLEDKHENDNAPAGQ
jgi:predicted  nucleic acid-binding Zn-ribbon protein